MEATYNRSFVSMGPTLNKPLMSTLEHVNGVKTIPVRSTPQQNALVYRPPHQSVESDENLYSNLSTIIRIKFCIVDGDFNCSVNWKTQIADCGEYAVIGFC